MNSKREQEWENFQDRLINEEAFRAKILKRFNSKIQIDPVTDCWEWIGSRTEMGYGVWKCVPQIVNSAFRVHRVAFVLFKFEKLSGEECSLHHCDNPPCCNPDHLFKGDRRDNAADRHQKGRDISPGAPGVRNQGAKLTEEEVQIIRNEFTPRKKSGPGCASSMAKRFSVTNMAIWRIATRRTWAHVVHQP